MDVLIGAVLAVAMVSGALAPYFWRRYPRNKR
jgi:hypothetical protein